MAITGVPILPEPASNQSIGADQQTFSKALTAQARNASVGRPIEDTFTPSTAAAQTEPLAIANSRGIAPTPTPPQPTSVTPAASTTSAAEAASTLVQIQSLNTILLNLGLNNKDIQQIDLIAKATKSFNPSSYIGVIQSDRTQAAQQGAPTENQQTPKTKVATG